MIVFTIADQKQTNESVFGTTSSFIVIVVMIPVGLSSALQYEYNLFAHWRNLLYWMGSVRLRTCPSTIQTGLLEKISM
jgi:hypothetical protein